MAFIAGVGARLMLNNAFFSFNLADISTDPDFQRTTSSEGFTNALGNGIGFHSGIKANRQMTASITQVTYDPTANLFALPFNVEEGNVVVFQLWPGGIGGVSYYCPTMFVAGITHRIDINALQPVTLRMLSLGEYTLPAT